MRTLTLIERGIVLLAHEGEDQDQDQWDFSLDCELKRLMDIYLSRDVQSNERSVSIKVS